MMSDTKWAPDRIWLQRGMGDEGSHTWCENSIGDAIEEAEYVRSDAAPVAPAEDDASDGELIADLIEQNRTLRARLDSAQKPAASAQKGLTNERIREIFWSIRDPEKGDYLQFARALLREAEGT